MGKHSVFAALIILAALIVIALNSRSRSTVPSDAIGSTNAAVSNEVDSSTESSVRTGTTRITSTASSSATPAVQPGREPLRSTVAINAIFGTVTSTEGVPIADAQIDVGNHSTTSSLDGTYRLEGLKQKFIPTLEVSHPAYNSAVVTSVTISSEPVNLVMFEKPNAEFVGLVVDYQSTAPVANISVTAGHYKPVIDPEVPGRFTISRVVLGDEFPLRISAPGYATLATRVTHELGRNQERTFRLGPGGRVTGRVIQRDGQKPVAGVEVLFTEARSRRNNEQIMNDDTSLTLTTKADGSFEATRLSPGNYRMFLFPPAPLSQWSQMITSTHNGETNLGDIPLGNGGVVTGKVIRVPGNQPVQGEVVRLLDWMTQNSRPQFATSDAQGKFQFSGLSGGRYGINLDKYDLREYVNVQQENMAEVTLRIGAGTLRGLVVRRGQPLEATLRFSRDSAGDTGQTIRSSPEGTFQVSGLAPGHWNVQISFEIENRYHRTHDSVEMPEIGDVEKTFAVASGVIRGRVINSAGLPVPSASILMLVPDPGTLFESIPTRTRSAVSDNTGHFEIHDMSPGRHSLIARQAGAGTSPITEVVVPEDGESQELELKVSRENTGTLVSIALNFTTGQPVPSAWCLLSTANGRMGHGRQRDRNGVMTITDLPAGTYHVQVSASGFSVNEHTVEIQPGETETLTDVIYESGAFHWSLVDSNGAGVEGVRCQLLPADAESIERPREGVSDAGGLWVARGLMPGNYTAVASPPGRAEVRLPVTIAANHLNAQTLTIR